MDGLPFMLGIILTIKKGFPNVRTVPRHSTCYFQLKLLKGDYKKITNYRHKKSCLLLKAAFPGNV
jgi:hypothetical protein